MRLLCCICPVFALAVAAAAQETKANPLTAKEGADGWILLFDGETTFGWDRVGKSEWLIVDGVLSPRAGNTGALLTVAEFGSYQLSFEYQAKRRGQAQILVGCDRSVKPERLEENAALRPDRPFDLMVLEATDGLWARATMTVKANIVCQRSAETSRWRSSSESKLSVIDAKVRKDPEEFGRGHIALAGTDFAIRNLKLKPLGMKPLFNGKDLTGWKVFPGKKSQFTVTDKGAINVKDGPGDLQTEGRYAAFLLQLECLSHGQHLNSGIFFRCRDGEYQNGYEAQIRNEFTKEPTQKYIIEEYDPHTHKLTGKKEIKATAKDYGTGAIYRRQPARKEMAKDGEWFAMTVAAHKNHMATWVNGIQVTDWTDNRPRSDNARTGCRLEAGHISIQGHDPTTNLSFRNLRIAEIK